MATPSRCRLILGVGIAWSFLCMLLALGVPDAEPSIGSILIGANMFLAGVVVFLLHPDRNLTATSIFALSSAIFIGAGAVCTTTMMHDLDNRKLLWTTFFFCLGAHITLLSSILCSPAPKGLTNVHERQDLLHSTRAAVGKFQPVRPMILLVSVLIFLTATIIIKFFEPEGVSLWFENGSPLSRGLFVVSAVTIVYAATLCHRSLLFKLAICALMLVAYYVVVFAGYGRLQLAVFGLGFLIIALANTARDTSITRSLIVILVCLIPFSVVGGYIGQIRSAEETVSVSPDISFAAGKGLESAIFLLADFIRLLDAREDIPVAAYPLGMGDTYWKAMVWLVPRKLWPDKPGGFGAELTEILEPQYVYYGKTILVTAYGELFYNFGWTGILLGGAFLGWILSQIDRLGLSMRCPAHGPVMRLFLVCAYSLLCSGTANFVWGGLATFTHRTGTGLVFLVGLSLVMASIAKPVLCKAGLQKPRFPYPGPVSWRRHTGRR